MDPNHLTQPSVSQSPHRLTSYQSLHQTAIPSCRTRPSSNFSLALPHSATVQSLTRHSSHMRCSRTWTPSSGGLGLLSDADEVQDRAIFVLEYNRLAKKHGIRLLVVEDFESQQATQADQERTPEKRSWFFRIFRGPASHSTPTKPAPLPRPRHRRSVSDLGYLVHSRREPPKILDIQTMVRLSGKSVLYLPQDYSPCALILPTCVRATAQYIAQNATTRGIFRIPGSVKIVNSIFDYYCYMGNDSLEVAGTVCCATLPTHIQYSVHDVGSTFKRLLSVLPGGILGSLSLFDAFVGIHSQLHGEPEFPRTKQTKVRARLIALAIGTIESQFRREVICAVFGLLSLIGRVAEVSPREDADGRPLPTGDLMGYNALGIVFGPLLVGDLLEKYTMKLASPTSGLLLFPLSPRKQRRDRQKAKTDGNPKLEPPHVDKVMVANGIAEMLITNWRDIVRQMRALGTHYRHETALTRLNQDHFQPSTSESFVIKMPQDLNEGKTGNEGGLVDREHSPEPQTPTVALKRRRSRLSKKTSANRLSEKPSTCPLSPALEEIAVEGELRKDKVRFIHNQSPGVSRDSKGKSITGREDNSELPTSSQQPLTGKHGHVEQNVGCMLIDHEDSQMSLSRLEDDNTTLHIPTIYVESVPPRLSSRQSRQCDGSVTTSTISSPAHNTVTHIPDEGLRSFETPERSSGSGRENVQSPPQSRSHIRSPLASVEPHEPVKPSRAPTLHSLGESCYGASIAESLTVVSELLPDTKRDFQTCIHHQATPESSKVVGRGSTTPVASSFFGRGGEANGSSDPKNETTTGRIEGTLNAGYSKNGVEQDLLSCHAQKAPHWDKIAIENPDHRQPEKPIVGNKLPDFNSVASDFGYPSREQSIYETHHAVRSGESETPSKQRSVKALAAMFEIQQPAQDTSPMRRQIQVGSSHVSAKSQSSIDYVEPPKPPPLPSDGRSTKFHLLGKAPDSSIGASVDVQASDKVDLHISTPPGAAEHITGQGREMKCYDEQFTPSRMPGKRVQTAQTPKILPSLETKVSSPKITPSVQDLDLRRPRSASTIPLHGNGHQHKPNQPHTPVRAMSMHTLQLQILHLQQVLTIKTEEIAQLKKQLGEQLKEANKDARMWKERVEVAERRMRMFERFTAKLRGIQGSMTAKGSRRSSANQQSEWRSGLESTNGENVEGNHHHTTRVRFAGNSRIVTKGVEEVMMSDDSGMLEDGDVVPARIRNCLHHNMGRYVSSLDIPEAEPGDLHGGDGVASPTDDMARNFGLAAVEMWIAAQELLRMEDEEAFRADPSVAGVDG